MEYEEVINTIENKRRFGKAYGRDVTVEFMKKLGNPEKDFKVIHIAGTNGKGSTAAFVTSILQAASFDGKEKFKVGTFISPHLIDFTERIMVDGVQIPRADATRIGQMLLNVQMDLEPTMFDYCLAMAMVYFKEQGVKYLVLETGLGGAKDSTAGLSVVPEVSAITSIGLEHTAILGDTIEKIAGEKAGIIKKGTRVVVGALPEEAMSVIADRSRLLGAPLIKTEPLAPEVKLGLFGDYQRYNGAVAAEIIRNLDIKISDETILAGLAKAKWPGRMDIISKEPFIMLDGAHNPQGVKALHDSLVAKFPGEKFTFIMAVMADKNYIEMAEIIGNLAERMYTCSIEYSRAKQADTLAQELQAAGLNASCCQNYEVALTQAKAHPEKIIIFGSLYFIGQVLSDLGQTHEK